MKTESTFFEALTLAAKETVQSAFIAWLFSDQCKGISLKSKIKALKEIFGIKADLNDIKKIEAKTEWQNIDILFALYESIEENATPTYVLVIENKVKCALHDNQLKRYQIQLESEYILRDIDTEAQSTAHNTNPYYVDEKCRYYRYLTLLPCKSESESEGWTNISYQDIIKAIDLVLENSLSDEAYYAHIDFHIIKSYRDSINQMCEVAKIAMETPSIMFGTEEENSPKYVTYYNYVNRYKLRHVLQVYYFELIKDNIRKIVSKSFKSKEIDQSIYPKVGYGMQSDNAEIGISIHGGELVNKYLNLAYKHNSEQGFGIYFQGGAFKVDVAKDYTDKEHYEDNMKLLMERGFLRKARSKGDKTETIFDYYKSKDSRWKVNPPRSRPRMAMSIGIKELLYIPSEWYLQPEPNELLYKGFEQCSFILLDLLSKYNEWISKRKSSEFS